MKNQLRLLGGTLLCGLVLHSCVKDILNIETISTTSANKYAVPLADLKISVADILNVRDDGVVRIYDPNVALPHGDSAFFLQIEFSDTITPVRMSDFPSAGGVVPAGANYSVPKDRVDLKLFGNFENGYFRLTDPSVEFVVLNNTDFGFTLTFRDGTNNDLYTERKDNTNTRYLRITDPDHPYSIPAKEANGPSTYSFNLNNSNVEYTAQPGSGDAMSQIMEPTPKYLYYGVNLRTTNFGTFTGSNDEKIDVVATVKLPLEGYGRVAMNRHVPFSLTSLVAGDTNATQTEQDSIIDMVLETVKAVELRFNIENEIPLEAFIEAYAIDSNTQEYYLRLPLYNDDRTTPSNGIVIPAAESGNSSTNYRPLASTQKTTDAIIVNDKSNNVLYPDPNMTEMEALARANQILIQVALYSAEENGLGNSKPVRIYDDYKLHLKLGARLETAINFQTAAK
ncbi:MAG: hypothetical protein Kow0075_07830 [Salibacteraceae bacterium]